MELMERVYWFPFEDLSIVSDENKYGQACDLAGRQYKMGGGGKLLTCDLNKCL